MIWIYTCWIIVLAGMQIVWHLHAITPDVLPPGAAPDRDTDLQTQQ